MNNQQAVLDTAVTAKVLSEVLCVSYTQGFRLITGRSQLTEGATELAMLKLDIHPTHKLVTKGA